MKPTYRIVLIALLAVHLGAGYALGQSVKCGKDEVRAGKEQRHCEVKSRGARHSCEVVFFWGKVREPFPEVRLLDSFEVRSRGKRVQLVERDDTQRESGDGDILGLGEPNLGDFNFDGTPDLQLGQDFPVVNQSYKYWLLHPESCVYIRKEDFDQISGANIELDRGSRTITVGARVSAGEWERTVYRVDLEGNPLELARATIYPGAGEDILRNLLPDHGDILPNVGDISPCHIELAVNRIYAKNETEISLAPECCGDDACKPRPISARAPKDSPKKKSVSITVNPKDWPENLKEGKSIKKIVDTYEYGILTKRAIHYR